jgi:hypothetical protein
MRKREQLPAVQLSLEELEHRATVGGIFPDVPELTPAESAQWEALRRARSDWVPQTALRYAWARVDPFHGRGGQIYMGRPRRPDDLGSGDGWSLASFRAALEEDRAEIALVVRQHPEQRDRLSDWLRQIEALGHQRDHDHAPGAGDYYERLIKLGYRGE